MSARAHGNLDGRRWREHLDLFAPVINEKCCSCGSADDHGGQVAIVARVFCEDTTELKKPLKWRYLGNLEGKFSPRSWPAYVLPVVAEDKL